MTQQIPYFNSRLDKTMNVEQFEQVVAAILDGKYSWACVLILRFAGYNPLHYIPYQTYNRLIKQNCQRGKTSRHKIDSIKTDKCCPQTEPKSVFVKKNLSLLTGTRLDTDNAVQSVQRISLEQLDQPTINRKAYPSDLTDAQWEVLSPLIPLEKVRGKHRSVNMREIVNAIFYWLHNGCSWRSLPDDLPPWQTVCSYFYQWQREGVWEQMNTALTRFCFLDHTNVSD